MKIYFTFLERGEEANVRVCGVGMRNFCNQIFFNKLSYYISIDYKHVQNVTFA